MIPEMKIKLLILYYFSQSIMYVTIFTEKLLFRCHIILLKWHEELNTNFIWLKITLIQFWKLTKQNFIIYDWKQKKKLPHSFALQMFISIWKNWQFLADNVLAVKITLYLQIPTFHNPALQAQRSVPILLHYKLLYEL